MGNIEVKVPVVGVGGDGLGGLTGRSRDLLTAADIVFGSDAVLGLLPGSGQLQNQQKQKPAATSQAQAIGDNS